MEIPILDEEEYANTYKLYGEAIQRRESGMTIEKSFKTKLNYYKEATGFEETEPNSIMHYRIGQYTACKNKEDLPNQPIPTLHSGTLWAS